MKETVHGTKYSEHSSVHHQKLSWNKQHQSEVGIVQQEVRLVKRKNTASVLELCDLISTNNNLISFFYCSAVIGEIDEETDSALDLGNIRAEPLNSVVH